MPLLLTGIVLFFGVHSLRIVSEGARGRLVERLGENAYKGVYSIASFVGIYLIGAGYARARQGSPVLYVPAEGLAHLALLLVPVGLVLVAAAYAPAGRIKAAVRHPMVAGVALWALAHLLANGSLADVLLFGSFLVWALADLAVALRREPQAGREGQAGGRGDLIALSIGAVATLALLAGVHEWLFGVSPLG